MSYSMVSLLQNDISRIKDILVYVLYALATAAAEVYAYNLLSAIYSFVPSFCAAAIMVFPTFIKEAGSGKPPTV
jgi:hypothetical protein